MKRVTELTPSDLEQVAVWRYEGPIDEAAVVYATGRTELPRRSGDVFIARTQFALANGSQHIGYCSPAGEWTLDELQPVIVAGAGHVYFWFDEPPTTEFLQEQWRTLGAGHAEVFPVHFRCTVPVDGEF